MSAIGAVVDEAGLVVTCGPGGVGKTTTSAALALAAARSGRRVMVLTVDPARRLADTLGIAADASGAPHHVTGTLWAEMLDATATFDRLIVERAGEERRAQAILANPVYRSISGSLAGAQEYMAIERLHQLWSSGDWDLIVVDTPPSRHAIDLLAAPDRLVTFLGHPVYRVLTAPTRSLAKVTHAGASAFLWAIRRLAGPQVVEDTIEFFRALSTMEVGLRARSAEAAAILRDASTAFVLVSSPRAEAIDEAGHLAAALRSGGFALRAAVINLVHPAPAALGRDDEIGDVPGPFTDQLAFHRDLTALAVDERREMDALRAMCGDVPVTEVPVLDDVNDLDGLGRIGDRLLA